MVCKSVHFLMSIHSSFAGGLFLAVLTESERENTESWNPSDRDSVVTVIQVLLDSGK